MLFYNTIRSRKDLALLVHDFGLHTREDKENRAYWRSLARTLRELKNLKVLLFRWSFTPFNPDPFAYILEGCTFQLESFTWLMPYESSLIPFLESQPFIRHLSLQWKPAHGSDSQIAPLAPSALPLLHALAGGAAVLDSILPGRKTVTHLHWTKEGGGVPRFNSIGPELSSIKVFHYDTGFGFVQFVKHLPNLEVLHWHTLSFNVIQIHFFHFLIAALGCHC